MDEYKLVVEILVKKLFPTGVISYKTDPRALEAAQVVVHGPPDPWILSVKVSRFETEIKFSKKHLGKIKVAQLLTDMEYALEQKMLRNIKVSGLIELDEVVLKAEF